MVTDQSVNSTPLLLHFLVNDVSFEISEELIQKRASNSLLASEDRRARFYDKTKNAYVFDQPADVFEVLVYFISTGLFSRPMNVNNLKLYSLLSFFEIDESIINTHKQMEHLVFEINWETTRSSIHSWIGTFFALPLTSKPKLINTFFFSMTMISYGNICFEYAFALPLFRSIPSTTDNTTMILNPIGLDFSPSSDHLVYRPEIIYLWILIIEFCCRFNYSSDKCQYFSNYLTIIDLLSILSCFGYLYCTLKSQVNLFIIQTIACFRLVRILKLSRYSTYIRHYMQTLFSHSHISLLLFILFFSLCTFFGNFIYGLSLIDRYQRHYTPLESLYYAYETILTIGFGVHIPSSPYLPGIILISVPFGMICLSLSIPFLAIYHFNLDNYEQEKIMMLN